MTDIEEYLKAILEELRGIKKELREIDDSIITLS